MANRPTPEANHEKLLALKEDIQEIKEMLKVLQEDYIQRKSVIRFVIWAASIGSAIASFFVTHVLDKIK